MCSAGVEQFNKLFNHNNVFFSIALMNDFFDLKI